MAIASFKPTTQPNTAPNLPKVEPTQYQSLITDDKLNPLRSLLAYVEGAPWQVNYYSQVVTAHNDLREIDPGQPNVYQQYQQITALELRVTSPLDTSYDSASGTTSSTGSAIIYPFLVPNVFDYFITDAGDAKKALFKITNVSRKTFNKDSVFAVDYILVGYIDVLTALYDDLISKVIRTYHFSKDRLIEGLQPLLHTDSYQQLVNLKDWYFDLVNYYFKTFFNRKYMTLVLPGQSSCFYDSFLVDYIIKIVDSFDADEVRFVKQIPVDNDPYLTQPQFWSLMLDRYYQGLLSCNQQMGVANRRVFNNNAYLHGVAFSNIDYLIYPIAPDTSAVVESGPDAAPLSMVDIVEATNVQGTLADLINDQYVDVNSTYPMIHTVLTDAFYVLSQSFYSGTVGQSLLELLTKDYLKQQTLDLTKLIALCEKYKSWGRLEQFYYGPILLTLIKEADRGTYS